MPIKRLTRDEYFIAMAQLVSSRGTCIRRKVGCVLVNERGHVLATGYNGRSSGMIHCIDDPCEGATSKSGRDLDLCEAIHAEQNALLQCKDVHEIATCYVTNTPCIYCLRLLMNTSCKRIVYYESYPNNEIATKLIFKWQESKTGREMTILNYIKTIIYRYRQRDIEYPGELEIVYE